jgi:precorrin-2 dehydrogenase / sirohydrochlorin ferrochelatase
VSTTGKSPALSRLLRDFLADSIPGSYIILARVLGELRQHISHFPGSPEEHKKMWDALIKSPILKHIESGNELAIEALLTSIFGRSITLAELGIHLHDKGTKR